MEAAASTEPFNFNEVVLNNKTDFGGKHPRKQEVLQKHPDSFRYSVLTHFKPTSNDGSSSVEQRTPFMHHNMGAVAGHIIEISHHSQLEFGVQSSYSKQPLQRGRRHDHVIPYPDPPLVLRCVLEQ